MLFIVDVPLCRSSSEGRGLEDKTSCPCTMKEWKLQGILKRVTFNRQLQLITLKFGQDSIVNNPNSIKKKIAESVYITLVTEDFGLLSHLKEKHK